MEDNVGTIVIGTKVDTKGLEKGLNETKKKIKDDVKISYNTEPSKKGKYADEKWHETELVSLEEINKKENELAEQRAKEIGNIQQINNELQNQIQKEQELENIKGATPEEPIEYEFIRGYTAQIEELQWKLNDLQATYNTLANEPGFNEQSVEARELEIQIEKVTEQLERMKQKQSKLDQNGFKGIEEKLGKMEKGFSGMVKKALRLGLTLVGIRTIINLITRSFNTLSQYNEELGTKIEQMRLVLAVALEPVINWLVNMLQVILSLVNQIMSSLFGMNLFGRASELWSKKMAKNMASGAGSAKEMKKQLAGFDEMNVIQDTSSSGGGGGAGSTSQPFDLEEVEPPEWMTWILENAPLIIGAIGGITTALILMKTFGLDPILSLGIGIIVAGIIMLILDLINYLNDPSWKNFGNIIRDIGIIIIGLGVTIAGLPAIVVGAILLIVGIIVKYWDEIKKFLEEKLKWIRDKGQDLYKNGHNIIEKFIGFFLQMFGDLFNWVIKTLDNLFKTWKDIFDGIIKFIKGVFTGNWKQAWDGIKQIVSALINNILGLFQNLLNLILGYFSRIGTAVGDVIGGSFKKVINSVLDWVQNKINSFIRAINKVIDKVNDIPGVNITRLSEVSLPRMKTGAILNQPGRGVPVGMAGEAGREGILPLTDARAMQLLGQEIGKWITVNANITNTMNGRVISRELQKINNENDFAFNS